jgi:hypothetical protein
VPARLIARRCVFPPCVGPACGNVTRAWFLRLPGPCRAVWVSNLPDQDAVPEDRHLVARVQRSRAIELRRATLGVDGAALFDGGNRHLVADAQRVAVSRRGFRGAVAILPMLNPMTAAATSTAARTRRRRVFIEVASSSELASFCSRKLFLACASVRECHPKSGGHRSGLANM